MTVFRGGQEDWVAESKRVNKVFFSELDVLLRALDRFFNMESLVGSGENLASKNFYDELVTVRDGIFRVLSILEVVIPEGRKNVYWFQKFADTKLLSPGDRDAFRGKLYSQESPEKGMYLLYDSFINLKGLISDVLKTGNVSYMSFMNVGNLVSKEIRENAFFNPFRSHLNPEFDIISNYEISHIVKKMVSKESKRYISVIYIHLFRFLRFLSFVDITTQRAVSLNSSLMILILLHNEITIFHAYIDKVSNKIRDDDLEMIIKSVAYQFSMESRRVYMQELRDVFRKKNTPGLRGKIENSHGILRNLTEQSIVQLTQHYKPDIRGEEIFSSFITKVQQSIRLREDLFTLHRIITNLLKKSVNPSARFRAFESLRNYMVYFESFTFRLLRYDDYGEFLAFFNELKLLKKDGIRNEGFDKMLQRTADFKIFVETTLRQIENRAELTEKPVDTERVNALAAQYL